MSKIIYFRDKGREQAERFARRVSGSGSTKVNVSALAEEIGAPRGTVSRWLKNPETIPLYAGIAMAKAVRIAPEELANIFKG